MLGDSLTKRIWSIRDCEIFSKKGRSFSSMGDLIINNNVNVRNRSAILIALGTIDISESLERQEERHREMRQFGWASKPPITVDHIVESFKALIYIIRQRNRVAKLLFSGILPRPFDYNPSEAFVRQVNRKIESVCVDYGMIFSYTYMWFDKGGLPVKGYFAQNDNFHLSDVGSGRLGQALGMALADSNLANPMMRKRKNDHQGKRHKSNNIRLV